MKFTIEGGSAFAFVHIDLEPGEKFKAESDAMTSMSAELDMKARFNGGFFSALMKKYFGKEPLFVNVFINNTNETKRVTLTQPVPGDIYAKELNGDSYCMQQGAFFGSSPGVKLKVKWAGFASWIAKEGLFKLVAKGTGIVLFGAFGALIEKEVTDEYIVDSSHLVAYEPAMKLKITLAGGIFSSIFGKEGFVTKVQGNGKIILQSRSLDGLTGWTNKFLN